MKHLVKKFTLLTATIAITITGCRTPDGSTLAGKETGGGHLRSHFDNPWFVQNTKEFTYCIKMDEKNFGISRQAAKASLMRAFSYWKTQFAEANRVVNEKFEGGGYSRPIPVRLFTQSYREDCKNPDVQVLFGVLSERQQLRLPTAPQYVIGQTKMTDYDPVNLRAKGFIYISPETGPLALRTKAKDRWSIYNHKYLDLVLKHEVAHLFKKEHVQLDLQRDGMAAYTELLSGSFLETILAEIGEEREFFNYVVEKKNAAGETAPAAQILETDDYFISNKGDNLFQNCLEDDGITCVDTMITQNRSRIKIEVLMFKEPASERKTFLEGTLVPENTSCDAEPWTIFTLTPEQKVFSKNDLGYQRDTHNDEQTYTVYPHYDCPKTYKINIQSREKSGDQDFFNFSRIEIRAGRATLYRDDSKRGFSLPFMKKMK